MSVKEKYTAEEWDLLSCTPMIIGAAMSGAASSGVMGTMKEALASTQSTMGAAANYPDNPIIQTITAKPESIGDAREAASQQRAKLMGRIKERGVEKPEDLATLALDDCRKAAFLLAEKEDELVVMEYKNWLTAIADKVANAASEGGVLGFGGTRFSDAEKAFYNQVCEALGVDQIV